MKVVDITERKVDKSAKGKDIVFIYIIIGIEELKGGYFEVMKIQVKPRLGSSYGR